MGDVLSTRSILFVRVALLRGRPNQAAFKRYLSAKDITPASFFVGLPDQTVASIKNAVDVRKAASSLLDSARSKGLCKVFRREEVWKMIHRHFQQEGAPPLVVSPVSLDEETLIERRNTLIGYAFASRFYLLRAILFSRPPGNSLPGDSRRT